MRITEKFQAANKKKILEVNRKGLNRHFGEKAWNWKGGRRIKGNYPCPICGKPLFREKRYAERGCLPCAYKYRKPHGNLDREVSSAAHSYRARKIILKAGIKLGKDDCIHHKNGNWKDDRIENLEVISKYEHRRRYHNPKSEHYIVSIPRRSV